MGLLGGKYGVKATLRHMFPENVCTVPTHAEALRLTKVASRNETATVVDITVSLHKFASLTYKELKHALKHQIIRALQQSICVVCLIDDPLYKPKAKVVCDGGRDDKRRHALEEERVVASQLYEMTGDVLVLIPQGDAFSEANLNASTSCKAYIDDRKLRPRAVDIMLNSVFATVVEEMTALGNEYILVIDAIGSSTRAANAVRKTAILSSHIDQFPENRHSLHHGEGDLKAESQDRFIRQHIDAIHSPLLCDIRVILHATVDTDAFAIFLGSVAVTAHARCSTMQPVDAYRSVLSDKCQSLLALEAIVGPRGNQHAEHLVMCPSNLYHAMTTRMGVHDDPVASDIAIAALITLWALAGCDFCTYKHGKIQQLTESLLVYLIEYSTTPFEGLLHHSTAKSASGALLAVWRRSALGLYAMTLHNGKRTRTVAPPPTDAQLSNAIWTGLYWRNAAPPEGDLENWHFHPEGVSDTTQTGSLECVVSSL